MMLCEETISKGRFIPMEKVVEQAVTLEAGEMPASMSGVVIPKNKNARRRLISDIKENVDKINRGTQFKRGGRPIPSSINHAIRTMR